MTRVVSTFLLVASVVLACDADESVIINEESSDDKHVDASVPQPPSASSEREDDHICNRRERVKFVLDGSVITAELPTLCDPMPYVEKGDPPPFNR